MRSSGFVLLLLLGYLLQFSLADHHLFSSRHLLQPSSTDDEAFPCSWDEENEECALSEAIFMTVQAALDGLFDHAEECGKQTSKASCPADMCSWTGTECSAADFYFNEEGIEECFGEDLLEFILIPERSQACEQNYTDEDSCNDTKDCTWIDGDDERCGLSILKSFGLNGLLAAGAKIVASTLGFTNASLRMLVAEWVNCKLESDEDGCLAEGRCEWDSKEVDCELGFGAVAQIVNATFPLELSTTCLALKSIYRTGCPGYRSQGECSGDSACKWLDDAGRCISTNAAIEGEANMQADDLSAKAGSTCMRADEKGDCSAITLADNNS